MNNRKIPTKNPNQKQGDIAGVVRYTVPYPGARLERKRLVEKYEEVYFYFYFLLFLLFLFLCLALLRKTYF